MQAGVTVYLEGPPELLAQRVMAQDGASSRPLLATDDGSACTLDGASEKLAALLREREASYRNADCVVSLKGKGPLGASAPEVCASAQRYRAFLDQSAQINSKKANRYGTIHCFLWTLCLKWRNP
jgi:shikimate kinase